MILILMTLFLSGVSVPDAPKTTVPLDTLEIIYAQVAYEGSVEALNDDDVLGEDWKPFFYPFSERKVPIVSSYLPAVERNSYGPWNTEDRDLRTAWIPDSRKREIGEYIEFLFCFPDYAPKYGAVYQFEGGCLIANGYCKSEKAWKENSRVKKLKVYYNDKAICYVELKDSWYIQDFDLRKFFKNRSSNTYLEAPYEILNGDRLRFEIVEVYKGSKYKDVAISEFLCMVGGN